jgi:hypothetical protein
LGGVMGFLRYSCAKLDCEVSRVSKGHFGLHSSRAVHQDGIGGAREGDENDQDGEHLVSSLTLLI